MEVFKILLLTIKDQTMQEAKNKTVLIALKFMEAILDLESMKAAGWAWEYRPNLKKLTKFLQLICKMILEMMKLKMLKMIIQEIQLMQDKERLMAKKI